MKHGDDIIDKKSVTCVLDQGVLRQALPNLLGPTE
jgi:hypothetical protein